ncbi:MAG: acyloxyacyl hydrolase [Vicingaceae bacterium]
MSRKAKLVFLLLVSFSFFSYAQETEKKRSTFIEPEYMFGKVLPMSTFYTFPSTTYQHVAALNIGTVNRDTTKWEKYYNLPETGVMLLYSNLGNNQILGHQFGVLPFVSFRILNKLNSPLQLKLGAGLSYFTHRFDSLGNPQNEIIGSQFTWDVKAFIYKSIYQKNGFKLKLGIGFSHESNGHTRLPNLGVNSPMASITGQFYNRKEDNFFKPKRTKRQNVSPKTYYITWEEGLGFHEQDETEGPPMGELKPVYSADLSGGILFNKHIKLRAGFTYRYYQTYYDHITKTKDVDLISEPKWNASNVSFYLGNEFLMGHASIDMLLGVNLHKPFYEKYNPSTAIGTTLQKRLLTRIGMNLYLINTHKLPKHNFFIGAHIKANMAKADYTDITVGYTFKIK